MAIDRHNNDRFNGQNPIRLGTVCFLNARPLTYGLEHETRVNLTADVPSKLAHKLDNGLLEAALVPSIDYQRAKKCWNILPAGLIGSKNTDILTVRLFSQVSPEKLGRIAADTDSHTSVALLQIIWSLKYDKKVEIAPLTQDTTDETAILLIGDKVINHLGKWRYEMDLSGQWTEITGLPFVFAFWAAPPDAPAEQITAILEEAKRLGMLNIDSIADKYAHSHGFGPDMARTYLNENLSFEFDRPKMMGLKRFFELAHKLGLTPHNRPLNIYNPISENNMANSK